MLAQTHVNVTSLCSLCLCVFFALRCAGQSPADDWDTLRGKLDVFQSTGEFTYEGGASGKGKFRWANQGQKYFLELNFVEKNGDAPDRVTLLSDGEKVAQCIFSPRLSKGCQVKVFDHKSAASENTATQYFFIRL